jgi:hypothetical protein
MAKPQHINVKMFLNAFVVTLLLYHQVERPNSYLIAKIVCPFLEKIALLFRIMMYFEGLS